MPEITNPKCHFCQGTDARATLAEALRSGNYAEQPEPWEGNLLRDNEDRYTVTGVAATAVSPCVWAQLEGQWHAVWLDELMHALPGRRNYGTEITDLTSEEEQALIRIGGGESRACPEITAQQLGLDTEYSFILHLNIAAMPAASREALGIPTSDQGDWPLDRMSFENAAKVLTEFPNALGACTCT